jgi:hypothetical protein
VAVAAHGYRRPSKDLDIVPNPGPENLERLGRALISINARPAELGDFDIDEMPADAPRLADLALGGNFRLEMDLGSLDPILVKPVSCERAVHATAPFAIAFPLTFPHQGDSGRLDFFWQGNLDRPGRHDRR